MEKLRRMSRVEPLSQVRKEHIQQVLRHTKGDLEWACRILGVNAEGLTGLLASHGLDMDGEPLRNCQSKEEA
ncbi:MAG: hypothetical protein V1797_09880 [Pseudomonadota bacterium]